VVKGFWKYILEIRKKSNFIEVIKKSIFIYFDYYDIIKAESRNGGFKMDIIKNPHDTLFKRTLGDKEVAKDFLKRYLPENILDEVDLTDINIAKDSFVDRKLKESFSDILYNVSINDRDGYIYLY